MTKEELEKEAEKWVKENMDCCKTDNSVNQSIPYFDDEERCCAKSAFQDGAEFGYNKANEWHYVKDGDLPKDDENFICMLENGYRLECYYDPTTKRWYDNFFHHDIEYGYYQSKVIAWKEIVLLK